MLIVCPSCASEYTIDAARIGAAGRKVRCAMCRETWTVRPYAGQAGETDGSARPGEGPPLIEGPAFSAAAMERPARARGERGKDVGARAGRRRGAGERSALALTILVLLAIPSAFAFRKDIVRSLPQTAGLFALAGFEVNLVGLRLADVASSVADEGGARVLTVEGEIRPAEARKVAVPGLEFRIEGRGGELLYHWSGKAPVAELGPGETARFTARLASPPPAGQRVIVSFRTGRADDAVALR